MKLTKVEKKVVLSRLLTRAGDQAWDFALPITLASLLPDQISTIAFIYLIVKSVTVVTMPFVARVVDRWDRLKTVLLASVVQAVGIPLAVLSVLAIFQDSTNLHSESSVYGSVAGVIIGSVLATLGSHLMEIAVGNDWVPSVVSEKRLSLVNTRIRQVDLATEVGSPLLAGLVLTFTASAHPVLGLLIAAGWNLISFAPEYWLLRTVYRSSENLTQALPLNCTQSESLAKKIQASWKTARSSPVFWLFVSSSLLWLSALSPHGVLLTSYLKVGWSFSELELGVLRGLGAGFGFAATLLFAQLTRRIDLLSRGRLFVLLQTTLLIAGLPFFFFGDQSRTFGWVFLGSLLFSRIGLYGFGLAEVELRQRMIPEGQRGLLNGFAQSMTTLASLILFGLGSLFADTHMFHILVFVSVISVATSSVIFFIWSGRVREERTFD